MQGSESSQGSSRTARAVQTGGVADLSQKDAGLHGSSHASPSCAARTQRRAGSGALDSQTKSGPQSEEHSSPTTKGMHVPAEKSDEEQRTPGWQSLLPHAPPRGTGTTQSPSTHADPKHGSPSEHASPRIGRGVHTPSTHRETSAGHCASRAQLQPRCWVPWQTPSWQPPGHGPQPHGAPTRGVGAHRSATHCQPAPQAGIAPQADGTCALHIPPRQSDGLVQRAVKSQLSPSARRGAHSHPSPQSINRQPSPVQNASSGDASRNDARHARASSTGNAGLGAGHRKKCRQKPGWHQDSPATPRP